MLNWVYRSGVTLKLIEPDKPNQNTYVESFNGWLRDECLNEYWFITWAHTKAMIEEWSKGIRRTETEEVVGRADACSVRKANGREGPYNDRQTPDPTAT